MRLGTWFYFHVLMEAFARTLCKSKRIKTSPDLDLKLDLHLAPGNEKERIGSSTLLQVASKIGVRI